MHIGIFALSDLAALGTLTVMVLGVLKWIARKEFAEPLDRVRESSAELAIEQRKSNEMNAKRFDKIDEVLDHHEVALTQHNEQIKTLYRLHGTL